MTSVNTILVPEDKNIEETWQAIQVRKEKITNWKEIIDKDEIERY